MKLERVFAKPFVSSLNEHTNGVDCIARHPRSLSVLLSGSCDGEVSICQFIAVHVVITFQVNASTSIMARAVVILVTI